MNDMLLKTFKASLSLNEFTEDCHKIVIEYSCPLCEGILTDAVIDPCGHSFCLLCVESLIKSNNSYPFTKNTLKINNLIRNTVVNTIIEKQQVHCKNAFSGCTWVDKLSKRKDHLYYECDKENIMCKFDCGNFFTRDLLPEHEKKCDLRVIECQFCKEKLKQANLQSHYQNNCYNYPKKCTCGMAIPASNFSEHLDNECEDKIINCPFNLVGCFFKDYRKEVRLHINNKLEYHLKMISEKISLQQETIIKQNMSINDLFQQNDLLKLEMYNLTANIEKKQSEMMSTIASVNKNFENLKQYSVIPFSNVISNSSSLNAQTQINALLESQNYNNNNNNTNYNSSKNNFNNSNLNYGSEEKKNSGFKNFISQNYSNNNNNYDEKEFNDIKEVFNFNLDKLLLEKVAKNYGWYGISFSLGDLTDKEKVILNIKVEKSAHGCIMFGLTFSDIKLPLIGGFYKNTSVESIMFYTFNHFIYKNGLVLSKKTQSFSSCIEGDIITLIIDFSNDKVVFRYNGVLENEIPDLTELKDKKELIRIAVDMTDCEDRISFI